MKLEGQAGAVFLFKIFNWKLVLLFKYLRRSGSWIFFKKRELVCQKMRRFWTLEQEETEQLRRSTRVRRIKSPVAEMFPNLVAAHEEQHQQQKWMSECKIDFVFLFTVEKFCITVDCSYTGLGYTGIRTYRTPRISVPRRNSSQYIFYSLVFGYTGFLIYRTQILSPSQSGIKAIDCISTVQWNFRR